MVIPWEVLEKPNVWLSVGVYGTNTDGTLVIPTIWANVCIIRAGATADGDPSADPTPPVWDQLNAEIEKLKDAIENGGGGSPGDVPGGGGKDGKDGFSPIAKVTQTSSGAVITITDANGTTATTVSNGKDGKDGTAGKDGVNGKDGADGKDGATAEEVVEKIIESEEVRELLTQEVVETIVEHTESKEVIVEEVLANVPAATSAKIAKATDGTVTITTPMSDGTTSVCVLTPGADGWPVMATIDGNAKSITWEGW